MKELSRAAVMLAVLVGLPAAWVYYGPLPPSAQKVVDRAIGVVKDATGWQQPYAEEHPVGGVAPPAAPVLSPRPEAEEVQTATPLPPPTQVVKSADVETPSRPDNLQERLEPLLAELRLLGPQKYSLETWGNGGRFYRFRCELTVAGQGNYLRHFEAVAESPEQSIRQVTAEIRAWQSQYATAHPGDERIASNRVAR